MATTATAPAARTAPKANAVLRDRPHFSVGRFFFWVLIVVILVYTIFPFYWAIITSLTPNSDVFQTPVAYWPRHFTFDNYTSLFSLEGQTTYDVGPFKVNEFTKALFNSTIVTVLTVGLSLIIGAIGAYAIGRIKFRGKSLILYTVLAMSMFPSIAILGSLYTIVTNLGLFNTYAALIISYLTFTLPFTIWVLTGFFRSMPAELEEAAIVDGATTMQTFRMVLLPLAAPGMVTTGLLAFISAWNEYLFALTFSDTTYLSRTVPVAIANFAGKSEHDLPWANIMAASVTVTIPLITLVLIFQRRILAGLTAGAVKG